MSTHDVIIVGAGHNGLTAAALLAKNGRKVVVLERRDRVGGLAAAEEFHPGYSGVGLHHDTTGVRRRVAEALRLENHGLRFRSDPPELTVLGEGSPGLVLGGAVPKAVASIRALSERDADAYLAYREFLSGIRGILETFLNEPPLELIGLSTRDLRGMLPHLLRIRRLGKDRMLELLRLPPMPVADWLSEWFETEPLKAALAGPALAGTFAGPRSPGTTANLLFREAVSGPGVSGGGPALVAALESAAREQGAAIRTSAPVAKIDPGRGVVLDDGEEVRAPVVGASCDPRHVFLGLLPPGSIDHRLERHVRGVRARGTTGRVLLALRSRPDIPEHARTGDGLDAIERAFDAVKYRAFPDRPVLDVHVPEGQNVVSVLAHYVPYDLERGWDDARREELGNVVVAELERHVPGVSSEIVAREVLTPVDLEERYGVSGGHTHHGEHALDQLLVRPVPECSRYRTPVPGLFLCGSGSHPGGGLTCAPGALAAATILGHRDLR